MSFTDRAARPSSADDRTSTVPSVLALVDAVLHEVVDGLGDALAVAADEHLRCTAGRAARTLAVLGERRQPPHHLFRHGLEAEGPLVELHLPGLEPGHQQQVVHHAQQPVRVAVARLHRAALALGEGPQLLAAQHGQVRLDGGERVLQVVGDVAEQLLAVLLQALEARDGRLQVLVAPGAVVAQPRHLVGGGELAGQRPQQRVRGLAAGAEDGQHAGDALGALERDGDGVLLAQDGVAR